MKSGKNGQSLFAFIWIRGFLEHLTFLYNVHILQVFVQILSIIYILFFPENLLRFS
ncbi:unnamed protein product [Prunus brigantina]